MPTSTALIGGGFAGCLAKTVTAPLDRLIVLSQTSGLLASGPAFGADRRVFREGGMLRGLRWIVHHEGVASLWRGNTCTCLHRFWHTGINFAMFGYCTSPGILGDSPRGRLASGAIASSIAVGAVYPLDLVRTRMMVETTQSPGCGQILRRLTTIWRREGLRGMFRGLGLALMSHVPPTAVSFCMYAPLKDALHVHGFVETSCMGTLLAGGASGVVGSMVTFPIDVLRRRLQVMGMVTATPSRTLLQDIAHIFQHDGLHGYWRGFKPDLARVFPQVAIMFYAFEYSKPVLDKLSG